MNSKDGFSFSISVNQPHYVSIYGAGTVYTYPVKIGEFNNLIYPVQDFQLLRNYVNSWNHNALQNVFFSKYTSVSLKHNDHIECMKRANIFFANLPIYQERFNLISSLRRQAEEQINKYYIEMIAKGALATARGDIFSNSTCSGNAWTLTRKALFDIYINVVERELCNSKVFEKFGFDGGKVCSTFIDVLNKDFEDYIINKDGIAMDIVAGLIDAAAESVGRSLASENFNQRQSNFNASILQTLSIVSTNLSLLAYSGSTDNAFSAVLANKNNIVNFIDNRIAYCGETLFGVTCFDGGMYGRLQGAKIDNQAAEFRQTITDLLRSAGSIFCIFGKGTAEAMFLVANAWQTLNNWTNFVNNKSLETIFTLYSSGYKSVISHDHMANRAFFPNTAMLEFRHKHEVDSNTNFYSDTESSSIKVSKIYPNPVSDILKIESQNNSISMLYNVTILDVNGKIISNSKFENEEILSIDMINFPVGIYFIKISNIIYNETHKVIKI